jgi:hypothetical protein
MPEPAQPAVELATDMATDVDERHPAALGPAEPTAPEAPDQPPAAAPAEWHAAPLLATPLPQPPQGDPLAALKAMSEDELIALFS